MIPNVSPIHPSDLRDKLKVLRPKDSIDGIPCASRYETCYFFLRDKEKAEAEYDEEIHQENGLYGQTS